MNEISEMMETVPPYMFGPEVTYEQILENMEIVDILPTPGACLKVKSNKGEKVFINICLSPLIPRLLIVPTTCGKNSFFFPKRYSKIRLETDKAGNQCKTFDIIINDQYFNEIKDKEDHRITLELFLLNNLPYTDLTINTETLIVLKNRKVMGTLQTQSIMVPKKEFETSVLYNLKSLITEIPSSPKTVCNNTITSVKLQNKNKELTRCNYVILKEPLNGIANNLIGLFQIPLGISSRDLIVLVDTDSIVITNNENKVLYNLCVPYTLNTDKTESFFDKDFMILRLNMPVHNK